MKVYFTKHICDFPSTYVNYVVILCLILIVIKIYNTKFITLTMFKCAVQQSKIYIHAVVQWIPELFNLAKLKRHTY